MTGAAAPAPARLPGVGEKLLAGDGLRAVCALMVINSHVAYFVGGVNTNAAVTLRESYGAGPGALLAGLAFSVFVFLALSGYLVGRPFLRAFVLGRSMPRLRPYIQNRLLRILPLFFVVWTVTWIVYRQSEGLRHILAPYLFIQIYDPTRLSRKLNQAWTVDVEMVFYIVLPLVIYGLARLMRWASPWGRATAILLLLGAGSALSVVVHERAFGTPEYFWPQALVFAFAPGLALATLEPLVAPRLRARGSARLLVGSLAAVGIAAAIAFIALRGTVLYWRTIAGAIAAAAMIVVPVVQQWATGGAWRGISGPVMTWIGERSYSLYLLHALVLRQFLEVVDGIDSIGLAYGLILAIMWTVMLPIAALTYRFIEVPFLQRKVDRGGFAKPQPAPATP